MKNFLQAGPITFCLFALAAPVQASLIGDSVDIVGCFPTLDTCTAPTTTTIVSGTADSFTYGASVTNIEANSVIITLGNGISGGVFNGIVISGIDWVGEPGRVLTSALLTNNTATGITPDDITFDDHTLFINLESAGSGSFAIELAAVPVPAAAWLFGSGLLGLVGLARRKV